VSTPHDILSRYLQPGVTLVGRYQLERAVGQGAYGAIYAAVDSVSHERVAIKALPPAGETASKTAQGRFKREMKVIESLVHPNIISLYDYGQTDQGVPFMVLEYVEGTTLESYVKQNPLGLRDGLDVMLQLMGALSAAHGKGVIHRDLKPANVMVVSDHHDAVSIKVLDFGMAKVLSKLGDESIVALTREGVAVGTPRYIAPEQARGLEVGPYTDLYAAGLLMYEIFTGERAVKADTIEAAVAAHVSREPLPLPEGDRVPRVVMPILDKLLAKRIEDRYQDPAEVTADLQRVERAMRQAQHRQAMEALPAPAPSAPRVGPPRIADASSLELDTARVSQFESERREREAGRYEGPREAPASFLRSSSVGLKVAEVIVALPLSVIGFTLFTAHFPDSGYSLRLGIGAAPFLVALVLGHFFEGRDERVSKARAALVCAVLLMVGAHTYSLNMLAAQLYQEPIWYLKPFSSLPLFSLAYDIMSAIGKGYANALLPIVETL
jgi:serine/threonine protein kinase